MSGKESKVIVGIDLGGTTIKIGIVNKMYDIITQISIPTEAARPYEQVVADMGKSVMKLLTENGHDLGECLGVGVGSKKNGCTASGVYALGAVRAQP